MSWKSTRMDGKVVVITGASSGLGKASAEDLAGRGAKVYMLGRNLEKTDNAAKDVLNATQASPDMVQVMLLDLASLQSVREFAANFRKRESRIHVLMNNAGVFNVQQSKTKDGFESHFGINVLGHYLLTHLLIDLLVAAAPGSRVINLSDYAHSFGTQEINWSDMMFRKEYDPLAAYSQSKLANVLFTVELSKRVKDVGITCYAVHPGAVDTKIGAHSVGWFTWMRQFTWLLKSAKDGAQTQIRCSIDPGYSEETGFYYANCKRKEPTREARSEEHSLHLWHILTRLVKLQPDEINVLLR